MPTITLPDGSQKQFSQPVTVMQVAESLGAGLAGAALGGEVDGQVVDTAHIIEHDTTVQVITNKSEAGLEIIRHSCAHLMAQAVKQLFPQAEVTIGPVIEDGFYYDFAYKESFEPDDLLKIEKRMKELAKANLPISRLVLSRDEAIQFFLNAGERYKAEIIESIPDDQELSFYKQGDFTDLCRGPHVPSTGKLKAFKLTKLAGAYWRGDSNNEMLQRIYGTAWQDKKSLGAYLHRLAEAEKRDHRKLGRRLDLFHFQPEAPGMVFWHEKGWRLHQILEQYIKDKLQKYNYKEVRTPQILDRSLWERSGHWDKFSEQMFTTQSENRKYAIKPMNCPAHIQLFNQGLKSYRDLPLRLAEFGLVHRNEPSGTLHGLMRARSFTQDDAHIFCSTDDLKQEINALIDLTLETYTDFGFDSVSVVVSTRPERSVGSDEQWSRAETALCDTVQKRGLEWTLQPGEGAFYGPKIEFVLHDSIGRKWQCGTIQVDFFMPESLGATYIDKNGTKQVPVMIHRAILGSMERFIGILIEHYAGTFPTWLAPVQVLVNSLTEQQADYAVQITSHLQKQGFRVEHDLRNETIGLKIREHTMQRVPYLVIVGAREVENHTVAVRMGGGKKLGELAVGEFVSRLEKEITERKHSILEE